MLVHLEPLITVLGTRTAKSSSGQEFMAVFSYNENSRFPWANENTTLFSNKTKEKKNKEKNGKRKKKSSQSCLSQTPSRMVVPRF